MTVEEQTIEWNGLVVLAISYVSDDDLLLGNMDRKDEYARRSTLPSPLGVLPAGLWGSTAADEVVLLAPL